jgi:hypothetical protein
VNLDLSTRVNSPRPFSFIFVLSIAGIVIYKIQGHLRYLDPVFRMVTTSPPVCLFTLFILPHDCPLTSLCHFYSRESTLGIAQHASSPHLSIPIDKIATNVLEMRSICSAKRDNGRYRRTEIIVEC